jgi:hypothetical protein
VPSRTRSISAYFSPSAAAGCPDASALP